MINRVFISVIMTASLTACTTGGSKNPVDYGIDPDAPAEVSVFVEPVPVASVSAPLAAPEVSQTAVNSTAAPAVSDANTPASAAATPTTRLALRENIPDSYQVQSGDTLWDIASLFLEDPWLWPEIWYFNPQISNPHLIYPNDIISLVYIDGQPQLRLDRDSDLPAVTEAPVEQIITPVPDPSSDTPVAAPGLKTFKLSPSIRSESIESAIPTVPLNAIRPFLIAPRIINETELNNAPYVVSSLDNHLITGVGDRIYVRGLDSANDSRYNVFRPGKRFFDPETGELLGIESLKVSEAQLNQFGDPSVLTITSSQRETLNGDRILPVEEGRLDFNFIPKAPENEIEGSIISLVDSISYTSTNQIVVINLGLNDGVDVGNVFAVDQRIPSARDFWSGERNDVVELPDIRIGLLMVFRVFDQLSYAIVVDAKRNIKVNDKIRNPNSVVDVYE